ncbi:hypothetical protein, partial [Escherichia coli]|uniref:hypothetical protein n=1 Tax=Escherichia coli TaxID=562 RepID=UPI003CFB4B8A
DRNRSHWSTSKTPSYTKSVSWQHHPSDNAYQNYYHFHEHYHGINSGIASAERLSRGSENFNI